jgi:hypothetical protein
MSGASQCAAILRHLKRNKRITPLEALALAGSLRLAARIYDLRKQGHKITTVIVRRGEARVAQYVMA